MHPNTLAVRVGSLHLYEDDVDQEDIALQQESSAAYHLFFISVSRNCVIILYLF
jgi:thymidylate synthase